MSKTMKPEPLPLKRKITLTVDAGLHDQARKRLEEAAINPRRLNAILAEIVEAELRKA